MFLTENYNYINYNKDFSKLYLFKFIYEPNSYINRTMFSLCVQHPCTYNMFDI